MKINVCLPSVGNEAMPKRLEAPASATCPIFERHKAWLQRALKYDMMWLLITLVINAIDSQGANVHYTSQGMCECWHGWIWTLHMG